MIRKVDLNAIAQDIISDFELVISEKNASITVHPLPVVEAVTLQMNQLLYNLLNNSLKFTAPGRSPVITIQARLLKKEEVLLHIQKPSQGEYYEISLTDNGIGFETQYAEQIFEIFKRLHGKEIYPGSGIGLALCKKIMNNHSGHIYAESRLGEGTTFHIILPA